MWNQPDKGELEAERENTFIDDIVQKAYMADALAVADYLCERFGQDKIYIMAFGKTNAT